MERELHYGDIYPQVVNKVNVNEELRLQYRQININFHKVNGNEELRLQYKQIKMDFRI